MTTYTTRDMAARRDLETIIESNRIAKKKAEITWELSPEDIVMLCKTYYPRPYYETYMLTLVRAVEQEVAHRIAEKVMQAPLTGMMDSYHVLRRKTVLDIIHNRPVMHDED